MATTLNGHIKTLKIMVNGKQTQQDHDALTSILSYLVQHRAALNAQHQRSISDTHRPLLNTPVFNCSGQRVY